MGLFNGGQSKEEKAQAKVEALMKKYRLEELDTKYVDSVKDINLELAGTGLMEFGLALSGVKTEEVTKMAYLNTLIQQNWIIIRQLDEIAKKLEK